MSNFLVPFTCKAFASPPEISSIPTNQSCVFTKFSLTRQCPSFGVLYHSANTTMDLQFFSYYVLFVSSIKEDINTKAEIITVVFTLYNHTWLLATIAAMVKIYIVFTLCQAT